MKRVYSTYLNILRNACAGVPEESTPREEEAQDLAALAASHCTAPFLFPCLKDCPQAAALKRQTEAMMLNYYQTEHFTGKVLALFRENRISCRLLKGISLSALYPLPEQRKLSDVDIYIGDTEDFRRAGQILREHGFRTDPKSCDHHDVFYYSMPNTGRVHVLELHFRVVGYFQYEAANHVIDAVFAPHRLGGCTQTVRDMEIPVLPPTETVFYLLLHMLKHYLYSGFGVRLLCDFLLYLQAYRNEIDFETLHGWCRECRVIHFYEILLGSLKRELGLPADIDPEVDCSPGDSDLFLTYILEDSDMGHDSSQVLVRAGSYRRVNLAACFKEGHLQMKLRFPRVSRVPLLWPFLWAATFLRFLWSTYTVRHITLRQTLEDFRSGNQKTMLIRVFDNEERKK